MTSWFKNLFTRNPVLNVLILAGIFNLFCAALVYDERGNASDQARAASRNLVSSVSRDISRNIEIIDLTIQKVVDRVNVPGFTELNSDLQSQLLFDQVATAQYFAAIAVVDENGRLRYHSRFSDLNIINVAKQQYFAIHRDHADVGLYVSLPINSPVGLGWGLVFSRRISHPDGKFAGIAYVGLGLEYFTDLFRRMDLGPNGSMSLMRADRKLLVREPFDERHLGADVSGAEIYRYYPQQRSGSFEARSSPVDGIPRLYTFAQIGDFPLTISVGTLPTGCLCRLAEPSSDNRRHSASPDWGHDCSGSQFAPGVPLAASRAPGRVAQRSTLPGRHEGRGYWDGASASRRNRVQG